MANKKISELTSLTTAVGTEELMVNSGGTSKKILVSDLHKNMTITGTVDGRDLETDGNKLDTIEDSADVTDTTNVVASLTAGTNVDISAGGIISSTDTIYTHPTSDGNKHIPSGGSSGQFLKYSSSGTATWGSVPAGDINGIDVFNGNGTWSRPSGVNKVWVTVVGGGGGAGKTGNNSDDGGMSTGGGGGGWCIDKAVTVNGNVTVTVGNGGTTSSNANSLSNGNAGTKSVFSNTTANGGNGGQGWSFNQPTSTSGNGGNCNGGFAGQRGGRAGEGGGGSVGGSGPGVGGDGGTSTSNSANVVPTAGGKGIVIIKY